MVVKCKNCYILCVIIGIALRRKQVNNFLVKIVDKLY